jgi:DNA-binding beta-propeller fold protein YncE
MLNFNRNDDNIYRKYTLNLILLIVTVVLSVNIICVLKVYGKEENEVNGQTHWPSANNAKIEFVRSISNATQLESKQQRNLWNKIVDVVLGSNKDKIKLHRPFGLSVFQDELYVVDSEKKAVYKIDFKEAEMKKFLHQKKDSFFSKGKNYFQQPIDVAVDDEKIFVSDSVAQEVLVFSQEGELINKLGTEKLKRPTGLGVIRDLNRLYVVDTVKSKIFIYDTKNYKLIKSFGRRGDTAGEFNYPIEIAVKNNKVYITDSMNFRIQIFDLEGKFISKFGHLGDSSGSFARPKGLAVDNEGHIYVVDALFGVVQIFNQEGELLLILGEEGNGQGEFCLPTGIYIDQEDKIYVADSYNNRIQIFRYLGRILAN